MSLSARNANPLARLKYTDFIYNRPCTMALICFIVMAGLCSMAVLFPWTLVDVGNFYTRGALEAARNDAIFELSKNAIVQISKVPEQTIQFQSESFGFILLPPKKSQPNGNVLTPDGLEVLYKIDKTIKEHRNYKELCLIEKNSTEQAVRFDLGDKCSDPTSILSYADFGFDSNGRTTQEKINAALTQLVATNNKGILSLLGEGFNSNQLSTNFTMAFYPIGRPLEGFEHPLQRESGCDVSSSLQACPYKKISGKNQYEIVAELAAPYIPLLQQIVTDNADKAEVIFAGNPIESIIIAEQVWRDIQLIIGATAVVTLCIFVFTGSCFLTITGIVHIYLSFPVTLGIFVGIYGFKVMTQLNLLSLFILIAVGTDDVLVFLDAWKQAVVEYPELETHPRARLAWTFRRSATSMLATSLTTCAAFFATAITVLPSIQALGIFAGTSIIVNYVLVITWFPAMVSFWHRQNWDKRRWIWQPRTAALIIDEKEIEVNSNINDNNNHQTKNYEQYRTIEKLYYHYISPGIVKYRFVFLALAVALGILFAVFASMIQPMKKNADFFDGEYQIIKFYNLLASDTPQTTYLQLQVVWGVAGIDRAGLDINDQNEFGVVQFDSEFNVGSAAVQNHLISACGQVLDPKWKSLINQPPVNASNPQITCPMTQFKDWCGDNSAGTNNSQYDCGGFPVSSLKVHDALAVFANDSLPPYGAKQFGNAEYFVTNDLGFKNGKLNWYRMRVNTSLPYDVNVEQLRQPREQWRKFETELNEKAPIGANKMFQTLLGFWTFVDSVDTLISGVVTGCLISLALGFVVISAITGNAILAFLATLSTGTTVVTTMGIIVMMGWALEIVETISLQVLIGLSVDYVLHVALAFNALSDDPTTPAGENRKKRAEMALTELGVSIIGGCLTTSIATAFLFPAALLLLRKFGQIILISVFISLFNTHFLFIPLVAIVGPVNNYGNIYFSMRKFMDNKNNVNPNT